MQRYRQDVIILVEMHCLFARVSSSCLLGISLWVWQRLKDMQGDIGVEFQRGSFFCPNGRWISSGGFNEGGYG